MKFLFLIKNIIFSYFPDCVNIFFYILELMEHNYNNYFNIHVW